MKDHGWFKLDGVSSEEFCIVMTAPPKIVFAKRDVENISVAGLSGDLTIDKGRYKNVTVHYECAFIPKTSQSLRELAVSALALLKPTANYKRLENSFHPDCYRMARISGAVSVESLVERAGKFTLEFNCKPQRFLVDGEYPYRFTEQSFIVNPTLEEAKPYITVYGTGPGELTVNGTTVQIKALEEQITLDCETQNAYRQVGEAAAENKNSDIYAPDFPILAPGDNAISWTGDITGVDIIPRWWTL